jgi:hypothetical protein
MAITWISWGVAPGYINFAPLGLFRSYTELYCERVKFGLFYLPQPTFATVALNIQPLSGLWGRFFFFPIPRFYYLAPLGTKVHLSGLDFIDKFS